MKAAWFRSSAWVVTEYLWYPLLIFASTPIFLRILGPAQYGLWMLLLTTVALGAVLNIGTGAATIKVISATLGHDDGSGLELAVRSSLGIALVGGGILAVIIIGVFQFGSGPLFAKMGAKGVVRMTGFTAAGLSLIEQLDNVYASALKGAQKFATAAKVEILAKSAQIVVGLAIISVHGGLPGLYVGLMFVAVFRLGSKVYLAATELRLQHLFVPCFKGTGQVLGYAKWGWVQGLGGLLFGFSDRLLVGSLLGATSLAYYMLATQLAQQIHSIPAAGFSILFPYISQKRAGQPGWSIGNIIRPAFAANVVVSGCLSFILIFFGKPLLRVWIGQEKADLCANILRVLSIAYLILAQNIVPHFVLLGLGRMRFVSLINVVAGVLSVAAMLVLIKIFGLTGVGYGRILYGFVTIAIPVYLYRIMSFEERPECIR